MSPGLAVGLCAVLAQSQDARDRMGGVPRLDNPDNNVRQPVREGDRRRYDKDGGFSEKQTGFSVHVAPDGRVKFKDRGGRLAGLGAVFDLTDWAMRMRGEDPYHYEKRKFLNETSVERGQMAVKDRKERLRLALRDLPFLLAAVGDARDLDARARRAVVFQLWDECAEKGDAEVLEAATKARAIIVAFARQKFPPGPTGYDEAQVRALNAHRKSAAPFAPYDATAP